MRNNRMSLRTMKEIAEDYRNGRLPEDVIAQLEKTNGKSIEELIALIDSILYDKHFSLKGMTLPELRRWKRNKDTLSEEEKQMYARVNGCTCERFEEVALRYIEYRETKNNEKKYLKRSREMEQMKRHMDQMVAEGKATTDDGICYVTTLSNVIGSMN